MSEKPYTARNWKWVFSGMVTAGLLLAGTAFAYDFDGMADSSAWQDGYGGGDYPANDPDYGGLRLLDPGYAFSVYDVYGYPGSGVRDYGGAGGYGYPGYGSSYGPITRSYSSPAYTGAADSTAAADRAYIRQLEERIRKLENANKQSLPFYGQRSNNPAMSSFSAGQPAYEAPAAGQFGQSTYPATGSPAGSSSEYPTYQPSYGSPPMYRFRQ
jgi:hypothetical protein